MRFSRKLVAIAIAVVVVTTSAGIASAAIRLAAHPTHNSVTATVVGKKKVKPGWQGAYTYPVATGDASLFFHYPCPTGEIALDGGYGLSATDPSANSILLIGNAPRTDVTPLYSEWGWTFTWPSGSSPAGTQITFNVYCAKH
jgi:hypothetical protein